MRVLHVHSGNRFGGIETILVTLAWNQSLSPALQHSFALCFEDILTVELKKAGGTVHPLPPVRIRNPLSVLKSNKALSSLLKNGAYDFVVFHSAWAQAIFGKTIRKTNVPVVFWLHNPTDGKFWLERSAARIKPAWILCNSRFTASSVHNLYPDAKNVIFYPPVAMDQTAKDRTAIRNELQTPQDAVVIIQVSRMESWKGQSVHLEALSTLKKNRNWMCWMVGGAQTAKEQEFESELKRKTKELGLESNVRFPGHRSDVASLLAAADIYCQPNTGPEPFGITFVEAMYAGLPVVTTNMGGSKEIVDSKCGILVEPQNVNELSQALESLVLQPSMRQELGSNGRVRAQELCDPQKQIKKLETIFESNLSEFHER